MNKQLSSNECKGRINLKRLVRLSRTLLLSSCKLCCLDLKFREPSYDSIFLFAFLDQKARG